MRARVKAALRCRKILAAAAFLATGSAACRKTTGDGARDSTRTAGVAPASDAAGEPGPEGDAGNTTAKLRAESDRFMPAPYGNLWIGQRRSEVLAAHPAARPTPNRADPERLDWLAFTGEHGVQVMLGFGKADQEGSQPLENVEFMSLLEFPRKAGGSPAALDPETRRWWLESVYAPHIAALRDRYGEKADVYSCPSGGRYPIVRVVWRGDLLAVTAAFMMGENGLASTLIVRRTVVADRYVKATRCTWMQDKVL